MQDYGVDSDTDEETGMAYRQLMHNHSQLMEEKKRMEDYFEQVDEEVGVPIANVSLAPSCPSTSLLRRLLATFGSFVSPQLPSHGAVPSPVLCCFFARAVAEKGKGHGSTAG